MKYIAIPVCLSAFVCSMAMARTLFYEQNGDTGCVGYYKNIPAGTATYCQIGDRVFTTPYYETINYYNVATGGTPLSTLPNTLPALERASGDPATPSSLTTTGATAVQTYFGTPRLCYPGYGYKAEGSAGSYTGFHCEKAVTQASGTYYTITLKTKDGNTTYTTLGYAIVKTGDSSMRLMWDTETNEIISGNYLPDNFLSQNGITRPGYTLRGFTNTQNVPDVTGSIDDGCNEGETWFGTRYYTAFDAAGSEEFRRTFTHGSPNNKNITLYATWYHDCENSNCQIYATGMCGGVGYSTTCQEDDATITSGYDTYNPTCEIKYYIDYLCDSSDGWKYTNVTPGDSVQLPDAASDCTRGTNNNYSFNGWAWGGTLLNGTATLTAEDFSSCSSRPGKCVVLHGNWTGADGIDTATNWADCEQVGGHWCTDSTPTLFTNFASNYTCVNTATMNATDMCCHDNRSNCNAFQCASSTNTAGFWNPSTTSGIANPNPTPSYCAANSEYNELKFASVPLQFWQVNTSSYNVRPWRAYKKTTELSEPWYYEDDNYIVDTRYTNGTSYTTGRHKVTKLNYVSTYYDNVALYPGFEFQGWWTGEHCTGTQCIDAVGNIVGNTNCSADNTTLNACWQEIDTTAPGANAIKVYFGTCDGVLRCGTFTKASEYADNNDPRYYGTWYGPLYIKNEKSPRTITLYYDPDLTTPVPSDMIPRISGFEWYTRLFNYTASDDTFPDDGEIGHDFRQYAFNPATYARNSSTNFAPENNRLMVHPGIIGQTTAIGTNSVSLLCGTGQRLDQTACNALTYAGGKSVAFINQDSNYQRAPSEFYVGPVKYGSNDKYTYYNMPCQCVKAGKFPCAWQTDDGRTLKTNVYYNNLNNVTTLTAIYECNEN